MQQVRVLQESVDQALVGLVQAQNDTIAILMRGLDQARLPSCAAPVPEPILAAANVGADDAAECGAVEQDDVDGIKFSDSCIIKLEEKARRHKLMLDSLQRIRHRSVALIEVNGGLLNKGMVLQLLESDHPMLFRL